MFYTKKNLNLKNNKQEKTTQNNFACDALLVQPLRYIFVDLNSYFASVEQQENPHLRGNAVGVVPTLKSQNAVIIAASKEAKKYGIKTGVTVKEAKIKFKNYWDNKKEVESKKEKLIFVEARPNLYVRYHHAIVEAVESVLPVTNVMSIDEMACFLTGSDRVLDKAKLLALKIKQKIREKAGDTLTCSIGIAPNRFLAKVASDMQKPDGLVVLEDKDIPFALYGLKIDDFPGIGAQMKKRLFSHNVKTVKELYNLSIEEMKNIWGSVCGERFWYWLRGFDLEIPVSDSVKTIGHSQVLAPEHRTLWGAYQVLQKLTHKVAQRLRQSSLWARGFEVFIDFYNDLPSFNVRIRLKDTQDTLTFLKVLKEVFLEFLKIKLQFQYSDIDSSSLAVFELKIVPKKVGVRLLNLIDNSNHELSLFEHLVFNGVSKHEKLSNVLDKINFKYGSDCVYFGGIHELQKNFREQSEPIAFGFIPDLEDDF
jgi:DNA polymerase-4